MKIITKAYQCEYCNKVSLNAGAMKHHEDCCKKNPKNRCCCPYCIHLTKKTIKYPAFDNGDIYVEPHTETTFHCDKKNIFLYHPKVLNMANNYKRETIMRGSQPMPTLSQGCDEFCDFQPYEENPFTIPNLDQT